MAIQIETVVGIPELGFGKGVTAEYADVMRALKPPVQDKQGQWKFQTFFVPADEPSEGITDPKERRKAARHACSKLATRFAGTARRIRDKDNTKWFAVRSGYQNPDDPSSPLGVRVYRVQPEDESPPEA